MKRTMLLRHVVVVITSALTLVACHESGVAPKAEAPPVPIFEATRSWPTLPDGWATGAISAITADALDNIWILHRPNEVNSPRAGKMAPSVLVFDTAGNFVRGWGGPGQGYQWPEREHGIFVDHNGYVWISGNAPQDHHILKFTRDGRFVLQIGRAGESGGNRDTTNVNRAADMTVDPVTDELFVADGYGNRRIIVFDAETGEFKRMWGAFGNQPTDPEPGRKERDPQQFDVVHSVRISNDRLVYVADRGNLRLQVFTPDGKYVTQVFLGRSEPDPQALASRTNESAFGKPAADLIHELAAAHQSVSKTAFSSDPEQRYLYVLDRSTQQVVVLDRRTLTPLDDFGRPGDNPGEFFILHDLVADSQGNLYTAEVNLGSRAQKFAFKGTRPVSPR